MRPIFLLLILFGPLAMAQTIPKTEVIPLPDNQVSFQVLGEEKTRWHFDPKYPRPFFYPFNGPSGGTLTRMGHPGAPNHDHHRSVWFAHNILNGHNFWADADNAPYVQQKQWLAYEDGESEAIMASLIGWYSAEGEEQMEQQLIASLIPLPNGEYCLEIQTTMRVPKGKEKVTLAKTNFGFLAVRVAKSISEFFGEGILTNSEGKIHEKDIFGKPAKWMDYSGPVYAGAGDGRKALVEGITFFDHPTNLRYPTHWHVRADGWMGASFGMNNEFTITKESPLTLRYLLYSHSGKYNHDTTASVADAFTNRPGFELVERPGSHRHFGVKRQ